MSLRERWETSVIFDSLENILNIGNKIIASAIWWKKHEYIFSYDNKIAQAREASAIYSLKNLHFLKLGDSPVSSSIQNHLLKILWRENATFLGNWASDIRKDR